MDLTGDNYTCGLIPVSAQDCSKPPPAAGKIWGCASPAWSVNYAETEVEGTFSSVMHALQLLPDTISASDEVPPASSSHQWPHRNIYALSKVQPCQLSDMSFPLSLHPLQFTSSNRPAAFFSSNIMLNTGCPNNIWGLLTLWTMANITGQYFGGIWLLMYLTYTCNILAWYILNIPAWYMLGIL
ncbi:hypothetical protein C8J57DRAFT_1265280 [Mycena rebaudengoi]|nr:hypothetical protein C8J57DRAFT_1265280 [Mycena rebaudengoi]